MEDLSKLPRDHTSEMEGETKEIEKRDQEEREK